MHFSARALLLLLLVSIAGCVGDEEPVDFDREAIVGPHSWTVSALDFAQDVDVVGSFVWYSAGKGIYRKPIGGGDSETICNPCVKTGQTAENVYGLAISGDNLYFTRSYGDGLLLHRRKISTGDTISFPMIMVDGSSTPGMSGGRELVLTSSAIYYWWGKTIVRIDRTTQEFTNVHVDASTIKQVDLGDGVLWFTAGFNVRKLNLTTNVASTAVSPFYAPSGVDRSGSWIYWVDSAEQLWRIPAAGGAWPELLATNVQPNTQPNYDVAASSDNTIVYVAGTSRVVAVEVATGEVTTLFDGNVPIATDLNAGDDEVYFRDTNGVYGATLGN